MHKRITSLLVAGMLASSLGGCVLSSQVIELSPQSNITRTQPQTQRAAMIRVEDQRKVKATMVGTRGGTDPQSSPIVASEPLTSTLTTRLQNTMALMGLGGTSTYDPIKVQMDITAFNYSCNDGVLVNECSMEMGLRITVLDGGKSFFKPFLVKETRSVATAPAASYNEEWINTMLDDLWKRIFTDSAVRQSLGVM